MYLAPACTFWLFIGSMLIEWRRMREAGALLLILQRPVSFAAAAAMGFMVRCALCLCYAGVETGLAPCRYCQGGGGGNKGR